MSGWPVKAAIVERKISRAAYRARGIAFFAAVLLVCSGVAHRFGLIETPPFFWLLAIVAILALLAVLLALFGLHRFWQLGVVGGGAATAALLLSLVVLAPYGIGLYRFIAYPRLTDISTNLVNPPSFRVAGAMRGPGMNPIVAMTAQDTLLQADAYADMTGRRYSLPADQVLGSIQALIARRGWEVLRDAGNQLDAGEATIEAVAFTPLLGFRSDVAIRLTNEGDSAYVDMRAVSRYGVHDLGTNADLIGSFLDDLDASVAASETLGSSG